MQSEEQHPIQWLKENDKQWSTQKVKFEKHEPYKKNGGLTMTKNTKEQKIINKIIAYSMLKYVFISTLYISGIPVPFVQQRRQWRSLRNCLILVDGNKDPVWF